MVMQPKAAGGSKSSKKPKTAAKSSKSAKKPKSAAKSSKSAKKLKTKGPRSTRSAFSVAISPRRDVKDRVAALAEAPFAMFRSDKGSEAVLNILGDEKQPFEVRLAALEALQTASFDPGLFASCRADYIATLRKIVDDANPEMRQRVLGLLAREKDGFAQKKLLEGLRNPDKALVPPEKALQLLSYDLHAEAYPIAREIVIKPPSDDAKREALRLLAADAGSVPLFEKVLRDKDELRETRQIAASALHALKPEKFQEHAREILLDEAEYDDIKATSLTALTQFGDAEALGNDQALQDSVGAFSTSKAPSEYKQSARQFLGKYGQ